KQTHIATLEKRFEQLIQRLEPHLLELDKVAHQLQETREDTEDETWWDRMTNIGCVNVMLSSICAPRIAVVLALVHALDEIRREEDAGEPLDDVIDTGHVVH